MSILRTQSFFLFTPVLLVSLFSTMISGIQAQLINHVPQSTTSPSPVLVNDVVYSMNHHSIVTMDISSFLSSPTPTGEIDTMVGEVLGAVRVDVSIRDDTAPSSESTISLSGLDSSTAQPPQPVSTLLLSSAKPIPPEPSTATSQDNSVPLSAIVGGAVGGCVVLIAFIAFVFVTRRQRGPHIEPYRFEPDVERHRPEEDHRRQMIQCSPPASDVPIIRPPTRKQSQPPSAHPLLHPGTKVPALYDLKVSVSATSLSGTLVPETPATRTFSRNHDGDTASVISHASRASDWRRPRPLPRPPTDNPPPVPALPLVAIRRDDSNSNPTTAAQAQARPALAVLPTPGGGQSLASSVSPLSPASPLDIDLGDYVNPGTSPQALSPARRDSQLEPSLGALRSPRRLPAPPAGVLSPPAPRTCAASRDWDWERDGEGGGHGDGEREREAEAGEAEAGPYFGLSFDADGRPDSPSVAKMYAELLELQRQVARLREGMPGAGRGFGELEAPPEYAESVVGSVIGSVCV